MEQSPASQNRRVSPIITFMGRSPCYWKVSLLSFYASKATDDLSFPAYYPYVQKKKNLLSCYTSCFRRAILFFPRQLSASPSLSILRFDSRRITSPSINFPRNFLAPTMADSDFRASNGFDNIAKEMDEEMNSLNRKYTEIVVIRHGETEWNAEGRIQGHLDVELNELGRKQAAAVAERLSKEPSISAVYSSDLKRAYETAKIIANLCGGLEVIKDPGLRERNLGDLQGLMLAEAAKHKAEAYKAFKYGKIDEEIPGGGESINQLYQRCTMSVRRITSEHKGERIVVVTHGGVIRSLQGLASSSHGGSRQKVLNTSVNILHLSHKGKWTIKTWGDVSHLEQTGVLESGFGGDKLSG